MSPPPPSKPPKETSAGRRDWVPPAGAAAALLLAWKVLGLALPIAAVLGALAYSFLASRPKDRPFDLYVVENIEAVAISVAMALVLKFFVIEAYQIPTGSMQPTILGDRQTGIMDRILADKLITMLRRPERWEVMIFRFPLDERRLYVKRIVGLPGETLEIRGGDLWVDGAIARKPDHVNESVLKVVHPESPGALEVSRWFGSDGEVETRGTRAELGPAGGVLGLRNTVLDDYLHGYDLSWGIGSHLGNQHAVADLDLGLALRLDDPAATLRLAFASDEGEALFVLPGPGSGEAARLELRSVRGELQRSVPMEGSPTLPVGREVELLARHVDRRAVLAVDGETWLRWDDDESGPRGERPQRAGLRLALDGKGGLDRLRVRRDIFYLPGPEGTAARWEIPEGAYFGMGDNTQNSHDSRSWQVISYRLADGRELSGFHFPPNRFGPVQSDANHMVLPDGRWSFADVHGDTSVFRKEQIVAQSLEAAPFIHERYLLGKASLVFWPVLDPFRWKLIR